MSEKINLKSRTVGVTVRDSNWEVNDVSKVTRSISFHEAYSFHQNSFASPFDEC